MTITSDKPVFSGGIATGGSKLLSLPHRRIEEALAHALDKARPGQEGFSLFLN
jgi:hypothetical protein